MNYRHAYKKTLPGGPENNTEALLATVYPGKVANVLINTYDAENGKPFCDGKWDAAFKAVGLKSAGFDLGNTPFGADGFDHWVFETDEKYGTMFDGFVFYLPIEELLLAVGLPGLMEDGFFEEAVREGCITKRCMVLWGRRFLP